MNKKNIVLLALTCGVVYQDAAGTKMKAFTGMVKSAGDTVDNAVTDFAKKFLKEGVQNSDEALKRIKAAIYATAGTAAAGGAVATGVVVHNKKKNKDQSTQEQDTQPPLTQPPLTQPPLTQQPVTQPQAAQQPVTQEQDTQSGWEEFLYT